MPANSTGSPTPIDSTTGKYGLEISAGCNSNQPTKQHPYLHKQSTQKVEHFTSVDRTLLKTILIAY
jgi:hypothetical protein